MAEQSGGARWHQALAFAVTGRRHPELGEQPTPAVAELSRALQSPGGPDELAEHVRVTLGARERWPHPVPADLMTGLGHAQFAAALAELQSALGLDRVSAAPARVGTDQVLSATERRLLDDVPPHHGS